MDYMDSNKIGQRIENKLIHALGRTISEATNDEIYKAAAECIRDDIMISWADSRKRIQEQGVKKLYYMSAEFLMGRAFSNNLINQGLRWNFQYSDAGSDMNMECFVRKL